MSSTTGAADAGSALVRLGNFFFRWRDALSPVVLLSLLVVTRPWIPARGVAWDISLDVVGLLVAFTGQALRVAVVGYAYIVRGGKDREVYAEDLVTRGFFATSRNPLYVGNLLIYCGLMMVWNSPWMYLLAVPFYLLMYRSIVAAEEEFLLRKFGDAYRRYCQRVNRWMPDLRRLPEGLVGMAFNWRRVLLKEYGTIAAWTLTGGLLLVLERTASPPYQRRAGEIPWIVGGMVGIVLLWGVTRWLKLSRRLRA